MTRQVRKEGTGAKRTSESLTWTLRCLEGVCSRDKETGTGEDRERGQGTVTTFSADFQWVPDTASLVLSPYFT